MLIKKVEMLITNCDMKKLQDNTEYCSVGLLSLDDGQKFDVSVRDKEVYGVLSPLSKAVVDLSLTNSKYGLKLSVLDLKLGEQI